MASCLKLEKSSLQCGPICRSLGRIGWNNLQRHIQCPLGIVKGTLFWAHRKHPAELLLMLAGAIPGTSAHPSDVLQAALTRSSSASCAQADPACLSAGLSSSWKKNTSSQHRRLISHWILGSHPAFHQYFPFCHQTGLARMRKISQQMRRIAISEHK